MLDLLIFDLSKELIIVLRCKITNRLLHSFQIQILRTLLINILLLYLHKLIQTILRILNIHRLQKLVSKIKWITINWIKIKWWNWHSSFSAFLSLHRLNLRFRSFLLLQYKHMLIPFSNTLGLSYLMLRNLIDLGTSVFVVHVYFDHWTTVFVVVCDCLLLFHLTT